MKMGAPFRAPFLALKDAKNIQNHDQNDRNPQKPSNDTLQGVSPYARYDG
jgi:hypothetical protein